MKKSIQLDQDKVFEFSTKQIGAVIQAPTGQGKTRFLLYLILSAANIGADVFFIDGKRSDLFALRFVFDETERNTHVAYTPGETCQLLRILVSEMNNRYITYFSNESSEIGNDYTHYNLRPVFLFFDELIAVMGEDKKLAKEIEGYLLQIMLKGRQCGIFAILSSQRFTAEILSTTIRENAGMRVAIGRMSKDSYKMVLGDFYNELPSAEKGVGKGYIYLDGLGWSTPRAFQTPYMDTSKIDVKETLKRLLKQGKSLYPCSNGNITTPITECSNDNCRNPCEAKG